jgi:hypothetical protein
MLTDSKEEYTERNTFHYISPLRSLQEAQGNLKGTTTRFLETRGERIR